jgi:serralysin
MLATNTFSHQGDGGSSAGERMAAAGYDFTGSWTWGENLAWYGTTGTVDLARGRRYP